MFSRTFRGEIAIWFSLGLIFFGSLIWAAHLDPHAYDWRFTVMSSLASPRDSPQAFGIACAGLALSGLLLAFFPAILRTRLEAASPEATRWGGRFFFLGALALTLSALFVPGHYRVLGIGRMHEHLAQISGVSFCLALLLYLRPLFRLRRTAPRTSGLALVLVLVPVTALAVSRLSLVVAWEFLRASTYQAVRASPWNSLAVWEWVGAVGIYFFLGLIISLPPVLSRTQEEMLSQVI